MIPITKKIKIKYHKSDIINLYLLFFISVIAVYMVPGEIAVVLQVVLLIAFYRSKKDYFWLAFVFIVENEIGFLFTKNDAPHSFSLIANSSLGNLYFSILFLLLAVIKYYDVKLRRVFFLKFNVALIILYFFIQLLSFGAYKVTAVVRLTMPWLLLFIVPRILKGEEDIYRFFRLIFSFIFIVLLTQSYKIISGFEFATLLGGIASEAFDRGRGIDEAGTALRPLYGILIPFLGIWGSMYFLTIKKSYFSKNYLNLILGLSVFSIFLTATRAWLIAVLCLTGFYIIIASSKTLKTLIQILISCIVIFILIQSIPFLKKQAAMSLSRYETLEFFLKGDLTAGGTSSRFNIRAKTPIEGFGENPVLGWGVGKEYDKYADGHVGYHNLLMSSGIIGFILWMILWLNFMRKMIQKYRKINKKNPYKKIPLVFVVFAFSILLIHSTAEWFNYLITFNNALAIALLFTLGNQIYYITNQTAKNLNDYFSEQHVSIGVCSS